MTDFSNIMGPDQILQYQRPTDAAAIAQDTARILESGMWSGQETPESRTLRELSSAFEYTPSSDVGFGTRIYNALAEETLFGQIMGDVGKPAFMPTGYSPSDGDLEKYAADLPEETVRRVVEDSQSFEEFLYELSQARLTQTRREELFSGGAFGFAAGLGATILAAGGEAVAVGLLTVATGFGAGAAETAQLAGKAVELSNRAKRLRGAMKAAGLSATFDVPMEVARYHLDNTLTVNDALIGIGASFGLGSALGAFKPDLYLGPAARISESAAVQDAAQVLERAGQKEAAEALRESQRVSVRVQALDDLDDPTEQVLDLPRGAATKEGTLDFEANRLGVETDGKKIEDIQQEVIAARRAEKQPDVEAQAQLQNRAITEQIEEDWAEATAPERQLMAVNYGVDPEFARNADPGELLNATIEGAKRAARTGQVVKTRVYTKPRHVVNADGTKGAKIRWGTTRNVQVSKRVFVLRGDIERVLYQIHRGRLGRTVKQTLINDLKERGVENPEWLAKEFYDAMVQMAGKVPQGKPIRVDFNKMTLPSKARRTGSQPEDVFIPAEGEDLFGRPAKIDVQVDQTRLTPRPGEAAFVGPGGPTPGEPLFVGPVAPAPGEPAFVGPKPPKAKAKKPTAVDRDDAIDDSLEPLSETKESVVVDQNGNQIAAGPADYLVLRPRSDDDVFYPMPTTGHDHGTRETLARAIDSIGTRDADGWFGLKALTNLFYKAFTPTAIRMAQSKSHSVRAFALIFLDNPRNAGGGSVTAVTRANSDIALSRLNSRLTRAKAAARADGTEMSDIELIRARRSGAVGGGAQGEALGAMDDFFSSVLDFGKRMGVMSEDIVSVGKSAARYFPRSWNPSKFNSMAARLGNGNRQEGLKKIENLLTESVMRGEGLQRYLDGTQESLEKAQKMSRKIAERIVEYGSDPDAYRNHQSAVATFDRLRGKFAEEMRAIHREGISEEEIDDLLSVVIPVVDRNPHLGHSQKRIDMDELYSADVDGTAVHIDELMDMDIRTVTARYAQTVFGAVGARQGIQAFTGKSTSTIADVIAAIRKNAANAGHTADEVDYFAEQAELAYKFITGQRVYGRQAMKFALGMNSLVQGTFGMVLGFAQLPEFANIFFRTSFTAALKQLDVGDVSNVFLMGLRGRIKDANRLSSALETFTGIGGDFHRGDHIMRRMDALGLDDDLSNTRFGRWLDAGRQFASLNPLGIMPMDTFLRRWASRAAFQHFVDTAFDIGPDGVVKLADSWWKMSKKRFAEIGLDEDDIARISKALQDPNIVTTRRGLFGNYKVADVALDRIEDQEAVDRLVLALRRATDNMIQRQTFGELPSWMNTTIGKILTQYRVFSVAAKSKQLAAGIARADMYEAANVIGGAYLAMLGYKAVTYYRALGHSNPEQYWEEKTQPEALMKSAIMRSGYSTILPMFTDLFSKAFTGEGVFDESMRTTGLGIDPVAGSTAYKVTSNIASSLFNGAQTLAGVREATQQDLRNIQSLLWVAKIPGVDQLINQSFINQFPDSNKPAATPMRAPRSVFR